MEIMKVEQRKDAFMPLFLLADPSKDMVGQLVWPWWWSMDRMHVS